MIEIGMLRNIHGNLPNSTLLVILHLEKLKELAQNLMKYHVGYKQSSDFLAKQAAIKVDYNPNDFFIELIDEAYADRDQDWVMVCK